MPALSLRSVPLQGFLLFVLLLAVYGRALSGPFVFDDQTALVGNASLHALWPLGPVLLQPPDLSTSGRPVFALSLALDHSVAGLDPRVFRLSNLVLHTVCALLLGALVRRTLRSPRLAERFGARADAVGAASTLLFALHPLASELVLYVTARSESLMGTAYLATLYSAFRAHDAERPARWIAAALGACALGMASKEVMVSAPLVAWLHERVFRAGAAPRPGIGPRADVPRGLRAALYGGLAATWALLAALHAGQPRGESAGLGLWVTPLVYLANQAVVLPEYLRLVVWPVGLHLDWGVPQPLALGDVVGGLALLVALLALSLYALWRRPAVGFVGVACFLVLAPSSSVLPIASEVGAERRMYLPLAALVALACAAASGWRAAPLLGALALSAFLWLGFARAGEFRSELELWRANLRATPENARARYNLSRALRAEGLRDEARAESRASLELERDFYRRILPLQPDRANAVADLGELAAIAGDTEEARARFDEALALAPDSTTALAGLARLLARHPDPARRDLDRARELAERALATSGGARAAREALDVVRAERAAAGLPP